MIKVILDAFGGDNAPDEIVKGALLALKEKEGFGVVLVGKESILKEMLSGSDYDAERLTFLNAEDVITNDDSPAEAVRKKGDSTIVKGIRTLFSDSDACAFVSAGATGAVLTAAVLLGKRLKGVSRPALAPVLPTVNGGKVILIDCGANSECKSEYLLQFALMGAAYSERAFGIKNPRVALLSNGTEDKKGSPLTKEAFSLLKECGKLNFLGNMEARELLSGSYDVVVSDGFSGNVCLKAAEGTALSMFSMIKDGIMAGGLRAKLGYLLLKPVFKKVKKTMDYNESGGAVLVGLEKPIIKSHGSSKAKAIKASVLQAVALSEASLSKGISENLSI